MRRRPTLRLPSRLRCAVRQVDDVRLVEVSGELSGRTRRRLQDLVFDLAADDAGPVVVDLAGLDYYDMDSLEGLLGAQRLVKWGRHCPVTLRGLEAATDRLMARAG
ncbi:MAG: STAS domain-containing protein [Actinomycetota bacterium]|nr:STAS domain-containing protein [Actinomycetota bacterium]